MEKKLYRDERRKMIAGVCAGLADYLNIDVTIVRVVFLLTLILKGGGGLLYIVLWIVLPKKTYYFDDPQVDYTVPPQQPFNPFPNMPPPGPAPFAMPPKKSSFGAMMVGIVMVIFGTFFLLDEFDVIPDWDIERLWPIILVGIGIIFIIKGQVKEPWEKDKWQSPGKKEDPTDNNHPTDNDHPADNINK
jgi:phage shock protein PspC (stress-responsive transcriptional regulator)